MNKVEGVAAPLEPTRQEFEKWANDPERRLHLDWDGERYELYEVELCWQAYRTAAAVSKNLQEELASTSKLVDYWKRRTEAAWEREENTFGKTWESVKRIAELEKKIAALGRDTGEKL